MKSLMDPAMAVSMMNKGLDKGLDKAEGIFNDLATDKDDDEEKQKTATKKTAAAAPEFMETFFADVEKSKAAITRIKGATTQIKQLQDEAMTAIGTEKEQEISSKLTKVLTQSNKDCAIAKRSLEALKTETEKMDKKKFQAEIRIRENIHATVLQNLVAAVRAYQQAQNDYKGKLAEKATRQVRVVKPDATKEEINTAIQTGDVNKIYRSAILEPGSDVVNQAYLHVADKYRDVLILEKSVEELHKMFLDLAVLVEAQGAMLDNIEHQVVTAKDYIVSGNKELNKALKAKKAGRRRMCCIIIVLVVIMAIILGPILGSFS